MLGAIVLGVPRVYQEFMYRLVYTARGKGKKKHAKTGGALDEVRMVAKSIAGERKSAKSAKSEEGGSIGRRLNAISSGVGGWDRASPGRTREGSSGQTRTRTRRRVDKIKGCL